MYCFSALMPGAEIQNYFSSASSLMAIFSVAEFF
jgi:hypothetical protein